MCFEKPKCVQALQSRDPMVPCPFRMLWISQVKGTKKPMLCGPFKSSSKMTLDSCCGLAASKVD